MNLLEETNFVFNEAITFRGILGRNRELFKKGSFTLRDKTELINGDCWVADKKGNFSYKKQQIKVEIGDRVMYHNGKFFLIENISSKKNSVAEASIDKHIIMKQRQQDGSWNTLGYTISVERYNKIKKLFEDLLLYHIQDMLPSEYIRIKELLDELNFTKGEKIEAND